MRSRTGWKYLANCFLLIIPVLVWNVLLTPELPGAYRPEVFMAHIPPYLTFLENFSRILVFALTLLMPLPLGKDGRGQGIMLYAVGLLLYFSSWLLLIYCPDSVWSRSLPGFIAPAFTPLFWLAGIGLIGDSFYFKFQYKSWYFILISMVFLIFHNLHACLVYLRIHG